MAILKRFIPLVFCVLLVCVCAVPVFATGTGTGGAMYPVLAWNTIAVGTNFQNQTEFAGRFLRIGNSYFDTTSELASQVTTAGSDYTASTEIYVGQGNRQIAFVGRDFVLEINKLNRLEILATNEEYSCDVTVTGQIGVMSLVGNYWRLVDYPINFMSRSGNLLSDFKSAVGNITSNSVVYVRNLEFSCYTSADVDDLDGYWYYDSSYTSQPPSIATFIGQQPMKYQNVVTVDPANPNNVSFVDWLAVGVGGFLQFELWEGFTLNQLIEFVVVIGLVLWFITLLI